MFFVEFGLPVDVELLLKQGADPNLIVDGRSPLGVAVHVGNENTTRILLSAGARTSSMFDGRSVIQLAVELGHTFIAKQLVSYGANVNFRTTSGRSSYALAICGGHAPTAAYIRETVESSRQTNLSSPRVGVSFDPDLDWLHKCNHKVDSRRRSSMEVDHDCNCDEPIISERDFTIWEHVDGDDDNQGLLQRHIGTSVKVRTIFSGGKLHPQLSELLAAGHDANEKCSAGYTALDHAIIEGDREAAHILLMHNAGMSHKMPGGHTPLTLAMFSGDYWRNPMIELLLESNYDVNADLSGPFNQSPLGLACHLLVSRNGNTHSANMMIESLMRGAPQHLIGSKCSNFVVQGVQKGILSGHTLNSFLSCIDKVTITDSIHNDTDPRSNILILAAERGWMDFVNTLRKRHELRDSIELALYEVLFHHDCRISRPEAPLWCDHGLQVLKVLLEWKTDFLRAGTMHMQAITNALSHGRDEVAEYLIMQCNQILLSNIALHTSHYESEIRTLKYAALDNGCTRSSKLLRSMENTESGLKLAEDMFTAPPVDIHDSHGRGDHQDTHDTQQQRNTSKHFDGTVELERRSAGSTLPQRQAQKTLKGPNALRFLERTATHDYNSFGELKAGATCEMMECSDNVGSTIQDREASGLATHATR